MLKPGSEALVGHFRLHQPGTPLGWPLPSPKGRPASPYCLPLAAHTQSPHLSSLPGRHCPLRCLRYINLTTLVKTIWGSPLNNESSKAFSCRARLGSQPQTLDPLQSWIPLGPCQPGRGGQAPSHPCSAHLHLPSWATPKKAGTSP